MNFIEGFLIFALCLQFYNWGTIWFCQSTVYPLFAKVGAAEYIDYHRSYARFIPASVIVPGFLSFLVPLVFLIWRPESVSLGLALANAAAGIVGFIVTVGLEIPRHNLLERNGKDDKLIAELIRYNWPRTISITVQGFLTLAMVLTVFRPV